MIHSGLRHHVAERQGLHASSSKQKACRVHASDCYSSADAPGDGLPHVPHHQAWIEKRTNPGFLQVLALAVVARMSLGRGLESCCFLYSFDPAFHQRLTFDMTHSNTCECEICEV